MFFWFVVFLLYAKLCRVDKRIYMHVQYVDHGYARISNVLPVYKPTIIEIRSWLVGMVDACGVTVLH